MFWIRSEDIEVISEDKDLEFTEKDVEEFNEFLDEACKETGGNRLLTILRLQKRLDDYIDSLRGIDRKGDPLKWVANNALAGFMEVPEFIDGLDWKWWTNKKGVDYDYLLEELADILHFIASGMLAVSYILGGDFVETSIKEDALLSSLLPKYELEFEEIRGSSDVEDMILVAMQASQYLLLIYSSVWDYKKEADKRCLNCEERRSLALTSLEAFKEVLNCVLVLADMLGKNPDDLFYAYIRKNFKNYVRQRSKGFRGGAYYAGNS